MPIEVEKNVCQRLADPISLPFFWGKKEYPGKKDETLSLEQTSLGYGESGENHSSMNMCDHTQRSLADRICVRELGG